MLLFKKPFHVGLQSGTITLTYRRWQKPHVRPGGRYRCHPIGVLEVDAVALVTVASITDADALAAGFTTRSALLDYLAELGELADTTEVYRVQLHHGGDGDRVELALEATLSDEDVQSIAGKLARMDREGPWTAATLALIDQQPRIAASKLAPQLGRETLPFKTDVRKLKKLGLTQSFEVGYEISPRGRTYLERAPASSPTASQSQSKSDAKSKSNPKLKKARPKSKSDAKPKSKSKKAKSNPKSKKAKSKA